MLLKLHISNYALIESLDLNFSNGFSVITGETGSGKSILLGALGLVLGKRADLTAMKSLEEKCVIEANFSLKGYNLLTFFEENDLDFAEETIIRREILPSGKSRAFVNDTPVALPILQELGTQLVDVHSQHQTLALTEQNFIYHILDAIANQKAEVAIFQEKFSQKKKLEKIIAQKKEILLQNQQQADYQSFLLQELEESKIQANEEEVLEQQLQQLQHKEQIVENLQMAYVRLNEDPFGILLQLKEARSGLQKIASYAEVYQQFLERIQSAEIELKDLSQEIQMAAEQMDASPSDMEKINVRLQVLYDLFRKHQVASSAELIEIQNQLAEQFSSTETLEAEIASLQSELNLLEAELLNIANQLHNKRVQFAPQLIVQLEDILAKLGMKEAKFFIPIQSVSSFNEKGNTQLEFLVATNKGSKENTLNKVASGGELSRIMLALKSILSAHVQLPTIIFDEIDTGVSGDIANKMAEIMQEMSTHMQVISITHLPQIASKGKQHYKVWKESNSTKTETKIQTLIEEERVFEIAQMLSGNQVSDTALQHAKSLLFSTS